MKPIIRKKNGAWIIELFGSLDMTTSDEVREVFSESVDARPSLILIDLGGLEFLKSSGFQALYELLDRAREEDIPIAVVGAHEGIRSVMHVFNLEQMIPIYDTIQEALEDLMT